MLQPIGRDLTVATSQFPISGCIATNARNIRRHIAAAARRGAQVVLFPEAALSGYAGVDFDSFEDFDWSLLRREFEGIQRAAAEHRCWALVGSAHAIAPDKPPTNCVYVIDASGEIETRYDKAMLFRKEIEHFSAGSSPTTFSIGGVLCGILICFDSCFPTLYEQLEEERVKVLFHAYYNARNEARGVLDGLMPSQVRARAYDYSYAIVASNSSARHSAMPSCIAIPDGRFSTLRRHTPGVLVETFAADDHFWNFRRGDSTSVRGAREAREEVGELDRMRDKRSLP